MRLRITCSRERVAVREWHRVPVQGGTQSRSGGGGCSLSETSPPRTGPNWSLPAPVRRGYLPVHVPAGPEGPRGRHLSEQPGGVCGPGTCSLSKVWRAGRLVTRPPTKTCVLPSSAGGWRRSVGWNFSQGRTQAVGSWCRPLRAVAARFDPERNVWGIT